MRMHTVSAPLLNFTCIFLIGMRTVTSAVMGVLIWAPAYLTRPDQLAAGRMDGRVVPPPLCSGVARVRTSPHLVPVLHRSTNISPAQLIRLSVSYIQSVSVSQSITARYMAPGTPLYFNYAILYCIVLYLPYLYCICTIIH